MIRTLIFDFDGTLHETGRIYVAAFRATREKLLADGYTVREYTDSEIEGWLGVNTPDMWAQFMPDLSPEQTDFYARYLGSVLNGLLSGPSAHLYDGAEETLTALKDQGYTMVILSNCMEAYRDAAIRRFGLDRLFTEFFCCQAYGDRPKEEIFPEIAGRYPGPFCVIGDRASDLKTAQVHGLYSIGCAYGYGTRAELAGADVIVDSVRNIPAAVGQFA